MTGTGPDPYQTLGVGPRASEEELRAAYRRLVQLHHPDHNGGSPDSARRFETVQAAYAQIRRLRSSPASGDRETTGGPAAPGEPEPAGGQSGTDSRLADMEREIRAARLAKERARQAAREAAAAQRPGRATDEELGYVTTDDSFAKILADARAGIGHGLSEAREHRAASRMAELIDELASKLTGDPPAPRPPRSRE